MTGFIDAMSSKALLADGAMGSYLFARTGRLSESSHLYEALSLYEPEAIRQVHFQYLQAGARCLTTNTFAANRVHLNSYGEGSRVSSFNKASSRIAREAIDTFREHQQIQDPFYVLGSVGPCPEGISPPEAAEAYREQLSALLEEEVDALLLETFSTLPQLLPVLELLQRLGPTAPIIVQMALRQSDKNWEKDPVVFAKSAHNLGARVFGINCCTPEEATAFVDAVENVDAVKNGKLLVSAMPNAGGFQRIGHRYMTGVNPEYMGRLARALSDRGVRLLGGCCEVHPPHIVEMNNYLQGRQAGASATLPVSLSRREPAGPDLKRENGRFSRKIQDGEFVVSVELLPSRGTAPRTLRSKIDFVDRLAASGLADAVDITDGSRGIPLMPPGDFRNATTYRSIPEISFQCCGISSGGQSTET